MDFNGVAEVWIPDGFVSKITEVVGKTERTLWENKITVTYHYNADGSQAEQSKYQRVKRNTTFTPMQQPFQRYGYSILGWNVYEHRQSQAPAYAAQRPITGGFQSNTDLYACWKESSTGTIYFLDNIAITITYVPNGAQAEPLTVNAWDDTETKLRAADTFVRTGYELYEWNTDKRGAGTGYKPDGSVRFETSQYLYAQWRAVTA